MPTELLEDTIGDIGGRMSKGYHRLSLVFKVFQRFVFKSPPTPLGS